MSFALAWQCENTKGIEELENFGQDSWYRMNLISSYRYFQFASLTSARTPSQSNSMASRVAERADAGARLESEDS